MKTSMCENCIKHKTIYCPNSDKCLAREDKPFYEDKYTILTRNEALEGVLKDYKQENQQLKEKNTQLKIQISAREEDYRKLEDKYIHNVPCCNEDDCDLYRNYMKLEDNWNKLKDFLETNWKETQDIWFVKIINKMQELERGVSDVED